MPAQQAVAARLKGGMEETIKKLDEAFAKLQSASDCRSLLKKHLIKQVFERYKYRKTLLDVIQSGVANLDSEVGVYATDVEAYTTFRELFDPIIKESHNGFKPSDRQPATDLREDMADDLVDLDPEGKFIVSTRIRCGRSLAGYPFNPVLTELNYKCTD